MHCTRYRVYFLYKFKRYLNCYFVPEVMGSHGTLCSVFKEDENVVYSYIGDPQIGADENSQLCVYVGEVSSHILISNNIDRPTEHSLPLTKLTNLSSEWKVG